MGAPKPVSAGGTIRVERQGNRASLNVFGTYAFLGLGALDDLIDALSKVADELAADV